MCLEPEEHENGYHRFWQTYFIDVIDGKRKGRGKKPPRKDMGHRVFSDVNGIGRPKAVKSIPILLGHYRRQLLQQILYL